MNMKEIYKYGNKKSLLKFLSEGSCGERGIRTPGTSRYDGFQDRCNRPLYHLSKFSQDDYSLVFLSGCKGTTIFWFHQIFCQLFFVFLQKNAFWGLISGKIGKK